MAEQKVYDGQNMDRSIRVEGSRGGYAPIVTVTIGEAGGYFTMHLNEYEANELAMMLAACAAAVSGVKEP